MFLRDDRESRKLTAEELERVSSVPPLDEDSSLPGRITEYHTTEFGDFEEISHVEGNGKREVQEDENEDDNVDLESMPEEAKVAREALKANLQLQRTLRAQLRSIEEAQTKNDLLKKRMLFFLGNQGNRNGQPLLRKINSPFFADMRGQVIGDF